MYKLGATSVLTILLLLVLGLKFSAPTYQHVHDHAQHTSHSHAHHTSTPHTHVAWWGNTKGQHHSHRCHDDALRKRTSARDNTSSSRHSLIIWIRPDVSVFWSLVDFQLLPLDFEPIKIKLPFIHNPVVTPLPKFESREEQPPTPPPRFA